MYIGGMHAHTDAIILYNPRKPRLEFKCASPMAMGMHVCV